MKGLHLALIFALNIIDASFTVVFTSVYGVEEANPLMRVLLEIHPAVFFIVKCALVLACVSYLDKKLRGKGRRLLTALLLIYVAIVMWHVYGAYLLWSTG